MADRPVLIVTDEETLRRIVDEAVSEALRLRSAPPRLLTPDEAGERLGVTKRTILRWAREQHLPHRRLGPREVRFVEAEILGWNADRKAS